MTQTETRARRPYAYVSRLGEYKGLTRRAVVEAMYRDATKHLDVSFDDWWAYQQRLWKLQKDFIIPDWDTKHAADVYLGFLCTTGLIGSA